MKKIILIAIPVILLLAGGGVFAALTLTPHKHAAIQNTAPAKPAPPKPLYFAAIDDIVVSIPDDAGNPPSDFLQFGMQFSTYDPNAVTAFTQLQPIIKSGLIGLLLNQTGKSLEDPASRDTLSQKGLALVNAVLTRNAGYTPANPFIAAYITNLVVQN